MKKCIIIFYVLLSLIFGSAAYANEGLTAAIKQANDVILKNHGIPDYFQMTNDNGKSINSDRWLEKERHLFAYSLPYGDTKETSEGIRYRYLGETMSGEEFTNPHFPHDEWKEGLKLENFRLYRHPWEQDDLQDYKVQGKDYRIESNRFNGNAIYLPSIQRGLEKFWADAIIGKNHPLWNKWHEYVHILQPPTQRAWGLGVAFHKDSRGIIWYVPIPMVPLVDISVPDLSTTLEAESFTNVNPGDKLTSTVTYKLNVDHPKEEAAWLRLHHVVDGVEYEVKLEPFNPLDASDEKGYIKLKPGESKKYRYTITVQRQATKVLARINPVSTDQDALWENNRAEAPVIRPLYDIRVEVIPDKYSYTAIDKAFISMKIYITRKDTTPISIPFTLSIDGPIGSFTVNKTLAVGDQYVGKYEFGGGPGSHTVSASAWPTGFEDIYPDDNRDSATVSVQSIELTKPDSGIRVELINGGPTYSR